MCVCVMEGIAIRAIETHGRREKGAGEVLAAAYSWLKGTKYSLQDSDLSI